MSRFAHRLEPLATNSRGARVLSCFVLAFMGACAGQPNLGAEGSNCQRSPDCQEGLQCIDLTCVAATGSEDGDSKIPGAMDDSNDASTEANETSSTDTSDDDSTSEATASSDTDDTKDTLPSTTTTTTTGNADTESSSDSDGDEGLDEESGSSDGDDVDDGEDDGIDSANDDAWDDDTSDGDGDDSANDDAWDEDTGDDGTDTDIPDESGWDDGEDDGGDSDAGCMDIECNAGDADACGEGRKCVPWRCGDGCCTNSTRCDDLNGDKQAGERCWRDEEGQQDDCDSTLFCMPNTGSTGQGGEGRCEQLCAPLPGTSGNCRDLGLPGQHCFAFNQGSFPVCLETCDPVTRDCANSGEECYLAIDNFFCTRPTAADGTNGEPGDPGDHCWTEQGCRGGTVCAPARLSAACDVPNCDPQTSDSCGCCATICDLESIDPDAVCSDTQAQTCVPVIENPGPDVEHVGVCVPI